MLTYKEYLHEKIENLFSEEEKEKYIDQIWELIHSSYKSVGGVKGSGFSSKEDIIQNIPMLKIYRKQDKVKIVFAYKDKGGRKKVLMATDGMSDSKEYLKKMINDEYSTGRSWGELSHGALRFIKTLYNEEELDSFSIPVERVKELLPDDEIFPIGKFEYERIIGDEGIVKRALGNPNSKPIK
jgi:hypothetical protein